MEIDSPAGTAPETFPPTISIPEIRDYQKINEELLRLLGEGHSLIRLEGAEGQRLIAAGLSGRWHARIEILGNVGPELAANLDAPGLEIVAHGHAADGAGRTLRQGSLRIEGHVTEGVGYGQLGGTIQVLGDAGHRAGLLQQGGALILVGQVGRLAGERQSGGLLFVRRGRVGPHLSRGQRGGRVVWLDESEPASPLDLDDVPLWNSVVSPRLS